MKISLQDVSEIIKTGGLVFGALWTAWTFQKLQRVRKAELENNRTLAEIQKSKLERQEVRTRLSSQQPQVGIEIQVDEGKFPAKEVGDCLCVTVVMKNEGDQNFQVEFTDRALTVGRFRFEEDGRSVIEDLRRTGPIVVLPDGDPPQAFSDRVFRVGQKRQLVFAVPIELPGAYFIQFFATYWKVPFDGEKPQTGDPVSIAAIEQVVHLTSDKIGRA
jgi:hypothetical protein